ncbi:MAG: DUF305 domain-containing protein [Gammaproteobacteria bacterium]|nr:DUF305 domain-containing protein [Gammaproteobacteria bacterium]OUT95296.1 MAG: DUF305 domain-containing protein [Gammaproteobacteria bacterium TMED36]
MKFRFRRLMTITLMIGYASVNAEVPILQPGAPGNPTKELDPETAIAIADSSYTAADAEFLQGMIVHHYQAFLMSEMAPSRTNNQTILDLAGRIDASQIDEIDFMENWLTERGKSVPDPTQTDHSHHHKMMGMATPEQMNKLEASNSTDFDRLYLNLMIRHHDGAIDMVDRLNEFPGSAYDPQLYEFVTDLENDQAVEIERMNGILISLSDDPRAGLKPGVYDAGIAILNMELTASLKKPTGFFDPDNPLERGVVEPDEDEENSESQEERSIESLASSQRYPMLSFSNTDMAFTEDMLVAGSYHGFNIYRLEEDGFPNLMTSVVCPGGQGDVSVVGDLLIMSVQDTRGRLDCGLQGVDPEPNEERFRGIRLFDISNPEMPVQVGAVQTCRGSHTHSVVEGPTSDGKIIVFNSGTSSIRDQEEMGDCFEDIPGDDRTALFRIDVIEIPIDNPSNSKIVDSPTVFADLETGVIAGLWRGGDHGDETQETEITDQCHDITVFPSASLAAGACSGNGILFDISDPTKPQRIDDVTDTGFAYWHSATFNNEGTKILFTDEWGGGGRARCRAWDPINWGANAIYDIVDGQLQFRSHFKMPAPQKETENCVAHNGAIIPVPGRDIFVQAWYQGGISVIDFTDSSNPIEIAYFDRGPILEDELITGGFWSVYYYEGTIYGTEITRGLDVFKLIPSEYLSENEIEAAELAYPQIGSKRLFNPQQQIPMTWPANPSVALSYVDQLERIGAIETDTKEDIRSLLSSFDDEISKGGNNRLSRKIRNISINKDTESDNAQRIQSLLKANLDGISEKLRRR